MYYVYLWQVPQKEYNAKDTPKDIIHKISASVVDVLRTTFAYEKKFFFFSYVKLYFSLYFSARGLYLLLTRET